MSTPERNPELIQKYLEDLASESELAELEQLLSTDPKFANDFAEAARLHSVLTEYFRKQYIMGQIADLLKSSEESSNAAAPNAAAVSPLLVARETGAAAEDSSPSTFVPRVAVTPVDSQKQFELRIRRVKQVAGALAALVCGIMLLLVWPPSDRRPHLVAGHASIAGQKIVSEISANATIDVTGMSPAVIDFGDGVLVELDPASRAVIRHESRQTVIEILSGRGQFTVPAASAKRLAFHIATPKETVVTPGGRFTLEVFSIVATDVPSTAPGPHPTLVIEVAEGSVQVQHAGFWTSIAAGSKRVLYDNIAG